MFCAAMLAVLGWVACGGGGNGTAKSTTPGVSGVHSAYVANTTGGSISEYAIDTGGVLHEISGSPITVSGNPVNLAMTPDGNILFASDPVKNTIFIFTINSTTGVLTAGTTQTVTGTPVTMVTSTNGKFLYVGYSGASKISVFSIGSGGALTEAAFSPITVNGPVQSLTASPKGTYLFATVPSTSSVYEFAPDATTGNLTPQNSPFTVGNTPGYVAVSPDETFAIVLDNNSLLNRLNIAAGGGLTIAANSPFIAGTKPVYAAIDSTNTFIYILNQGGNNISVLTYTAGAPHAVLNVLTGTTPVSMYLSSSNLYVTNSGDNTIQESAVSTTTTNGVTVPSITALSPVTLATGTKPQGLVVR